MNDDEEDEEDEEGMPMVQEKAEQRAKKAPETDPTPLVVNAAPELAMPMSPPSTAQKRAHESPPSSEEHFKPKKKKGKVAVLPLLISGPFPPID